jgi:hypothetical protein
VNPGLERRDVGSSRSLVRSPRRTEVCRTYRPHPTDTGLAGKRPARPLLSFAPPGSPFRDDLVPGQAEEARRCSPGVLALQSSLHHGSGFGHSRRHAQGASPTTHISGRPAIAVADRDPDSDAWTREPRIRRRVDSIEVRHATVRRRPSSRRVSRTLRAPVASPVPGPCRAHFGRSVLPVPPLGGTPRLPALHGRLPRKRATAAGPRRRSFVEPLTRPHPLRGRLATEPLAELGLVVRSPPCGSFQIDPGATGFRQ